MKIKFLGIAGLALLSFTISAHAQSSVTMYGIADAGIDYGKSGSFHKARVTSGGWTGARLGFRGSEDLGNGLSAVFRLEMGINLDTGSLAQGGLSFGREASVGIASTTWGSIVIGRTPIPYYAISPFFDAFFQGQSGALLATTRSTSTSAKYLLPLMAQARFNNSVLYTSPTWNGLQARLQLAGGEGSTAIGWAYSGTVRYTNGPVDLVVSRVRQNGSGSTNGSANAYQLAGSYDFKVAKVIAGYNRESNDCLTCTGVLARQEGLTPLGKGDFRLINLGVRVPVKALTVIAQVLRIQDRSDYANATGSRDVPWFAVGVEYKLSKRTTLWGSAGAVKNKNGSQYALSTGAPPREAGSVGAGDPISKNVGAGLTVTF